MDIAMNNLLSKEATAKLSYLEDIYQQLRAAEHMSDEINGGISYKETVIDLFGENVQALFYISSSQALPTIARLDGLRKLAQVSNSIQEEWKRELASSRLLAESSIPDDNSLIHACVESPVAALITCEAVMAIGCTRNWQEKITAIWGEQIAALDYCERGPDFYRQLLDVFTTYKPKAIYLRYRGLLVLADTIQQLTDHVSFFMRAMAFAISTQPSIAVSLSKIEQNLRVKIAEYRQEMSRAHGRQFLVRYLDEMPSHTWRARKACSESHLQLVNGEEMAVPQPDSISGMMIHARTQVELATKVRLVQSAAKIEQYASVFGEPEFLLAQSHAVEPDISEGIFAGEVALVTGAAMGIGKACTESLLARGAAVIALDIKSEIVGLFNTPAYLGMQCDLTNATETIECFEKGVRAFGGLDMLILNAGIFPASCTLASMSMEYWRKVMDINLDVNITLLRESYPLLRCAPRYGRVVINASRNVPAPGPGAAAYSASKAALTQLGRVAALEWGPSQIRVNMLNPHAVFDTGIWTDEVIKSRAAKYGLTVEQYKTNNILGVELKSHDIGELVAEMLGPVFSKTTGAQVPVDGGSDRVI
jgi:NAD(P)-dependent dehydrogenase (short-subunit alcohol dehydrogenase family)